MPVDTYKYNYFILCLELPRINH